MVIFHSYVTVYQRVLQQPPSLELFQFCFELLYFHPGWARHFFGSKGNWCTENLVNQWPFQEPKLELPTTYKYTMCMYIIYVYKACVRYVREYLDKIWPYIVQYLHFRVLKFPLSVGGPCSITKWGSGTGAIAQIRPWKRLMQSTYKSISK